MSALIDSIGAAYAQVDWTLGVLTWLVVLGSVIGAEIHHARGNTTSQRNFAKLFYPFHCVLAAGPPLHFLFAASQIEDGQPGLALLLTLSILSLFGTFYALEWLHRLIWRRLHKPQS
ncbi:MAG: hypothetical protein AAF291_02265 [Pseudomonadota bacterium]